MKRVDLFFALLNLVLDIVVLSAVFILVYFLRFKFGPTAISFGYQTPFSDYLRLLFLFIPLWILVFASNGLYQIRPARAYFDEFVRIFLSVSVSVLLALAALFLLRKADFSRLIFIYLFILSLLGISLIRILLLLLRRYLYRYGIGIIRVIFIGNNKIAKRLKKEILSDKSMGYFIVKHLKGFKDVSEIEKFLIDPGIDQIILAESHLLEREKKQIFEFCKDYKIGFSFIPDLFEVQTSNIEIYTRKNIPFISFKRTSLEGWGRIVKRLIDIVVSFFLLLLLAPLFLVVAILIKSDSQGPVFFLQERRGRNRAFRIIKFRSMIKNAEEKKKKLTHLNERKGPLFKIKDDPRVTKVGKILRQLRIDELPQLFNVLKGEMSLVGPRPHLPSEIKKYKRHHREVLIIKPGMTGLPQISGASNLSFEEEVRLDTYYIKNWTVVMDLAILVKTAWVVLTKKGAV